MRSIFIYDAFTKEKFSGNQAGVVLEADGLGREEKQNLARELGFSETVFVSKTKEADWSFEYFTPKQEVDLCGHATIAASYALFDEGEWEEKESVSIKTRAGIFKLFPEQKKGHLLSVWMEQDEGALSYDIQKNTKELAEALGLDEKEIKEGIKIVKAYSGLWDLMIPLRSKQALDSICGNFERIEALSEALGVISFHPFYIVEKQDKKEVYTRNFAPLVEIPEEAATGTSNGALAFYLHQIGYLRREEELTCHQGESMGRKSRILAKIDASGKIFVGGQAVRVLKGEYEG